MFEYISTLDKDLLLLINGFNSQKLDIVMIYISSKLGWLMLYVYLLYIIISDFGKKTWVVLVIIALVITVADLSSVHLFKNVFMRLRPCHEGDLVNQLHMAKNCGGMYGFVSSHAANSFALSTFLILLLRAKHSWIWPVMITYALLIIYSRVYLGVHYPSDVLGGAVLGTTVGWLCYRLFLLLEKRI